VDKLADVGKGALKQVAVVNVAGDDILVDFADNETAIHSCNLRAAKVFCPLVKLVYQERVVVLITSDQKM